MGQEWDAGDIAEVDGWAFECSGVGESDGGDEVVAEGVVDGDVGVEHVLVGFVLAVDLSNLRVVALPDGRLVSEG
jgi:hypothetical protein